MARQLPNILMSPHSEQVAAARIQAIFQSPLRSLSPFHAIPPALLLSADLRGFARNTAAGAYGPVEIFR